MARGLCTRIHKARGQEEKPGRWLCKKQLVISFGIPIRYLLLVSCQEHVYPGRSWVTDCIPACKFFCLDSLFFRQSSGFAFPFPWTIIVQTPETPFPCVPALINSPTWLFEAQFLFSHHSAKKQKQIKTTKTQKKFSQILNYNQVDKLLKNPKL